MYTYTNFFQYQFTLLPVLEVCNYDATQEENRMSPKDRLFKKEYVNELLSIARQDLGTAKVLIANGTVRPENTLFHMHQAVEKALRAVLCYQQKAIPMTHDLYAIIQLLPQDDLPPGGYGLNDLTPFAAIRRYEEGVDVYTKEYMQQALLMATQVVEWALIKIGRTSQKKS